MLRFKTTSGRINKFIRILNRLGKQLLDVCYHDGRTDPPSLEYEVFDDVDGVVWTRITIDVPMAKIEVLE